MFGSLGPMEIGIIALVVILLFGVGKLSGLGRDLGTSVKEFRRAIKDEDKEAAEKAAREAQAQASARPQQTYVQAQVEQPQVQAPAPQPSNNGQSQTTEKPNVF